jgi:DnaK suppressor protein
MTALEQHRDDALARIKEFDSDLAALRVARADANADDEHDPEGSTLSSDWSRIAGLRAEAVVQLEQAVAALIRVADGSYGTCVTCGRVIPPERLAARPAAAECVVCASVRR